MNLNRPEPVLTPAAIVGAIMAFFIFATKVGWLNIDPASVAGTENALQALLESLVPIIFILPGALYARSRVTPISDPRDSQGRKLIPELNDASQGAKAAGMQLHDQDLEPKDRRRLRRLQALALDELEKQLDDQDLEPKDRQSLALDVLKLGEVVAPAPSKVQ